MEDSLSIIGRNTVLQPFTANDITDEYVAWLNDPLVVRYSNQRFRIHTRTSSQQYLESFGGTENLFLSIRLKKTDVMVGTITAYCATHHQTADMGLLIGNRNFWGKGIGLDAWAILMGYLLNSIHFRKVTGGTLGCNVGMARIMEKSGMQLEAVRREQEIVEGHPQDVLYYAKFRNQ